MRCNVGVNPRFLVDSHLLAECMEIPMVIGSLKYWEFQIKSDIPPKFCLGPGHMNFLKNKLVYLKRRHDEVYKEILRRGFKNDKSRMHLEDVPEKFCNDWNPTIEDSNVLRGRLKWKLQNKPPHFWRYNRKNLDAAGMELVLDNICNGEMFYV